jgi:hypothetical protein
MTIVEQELVDPNETPHLDWGPETPRGGKAVMSRILKDNASVPLFFGQTLIQSLRDVGYNNTTSALCEHVDNAIQAGATEIRVFFRQRGKGGKSQTDIAVYDNGSGMAPAVLKVASSFGGSMTFGNRRGIGRFGMGMKTAALSVSPIMDLYSWQQPGAIYNLTLDVDAIGRDRSNMIVLPEPALTPTLPDEISELFSKPVAFPDKREQELFAPDNTPLEKRLGPSGTIVYMPACDRLSYARDRYLVDHAVKEMARVYRRVVGSGIDLYVNNRKVQPVDPTYSMQSARHMLVPDLPVRSSKLILSRSIRIKVNENQEEAVPITIKVYRLPVEDWADLPVKILKNDLRVFDDHIVSILRNDREVYAGTMPWLTTRHNVTHWYRVQIDFPGTLDEAFGVAANKQGVRLKEYVKNAIKNAIGDDISSLNDEIKRFQGQRASIRAAAKPSASETRASDVEPFQQNMIHPPLTPDEETQLVENLRGLAMTLRRDNETEDQAFERVSRSKYIIDFKHDEYWPFYDVRHRFGRIILTINTAHPFFSMLYDPVRKMNVAAEATDDTAIEARPRADDGPSVALDLLLLSLARTQSRLAATDDEAGKLMESLRREWSETYRVQLTV